MRHRDLRFLVLLISLLDANAAGRSEGQEARPSSPEMSRAVIQGRWDLTLHAPTREYSSWLEIKDEGGELHGLMVGRWGHAHPVLNLRFDKGVLLFESPKQQESMQADMPFQAKVVNGELVGTTTGPDGGAWSWSGRRAPALKGRAVQRWGKPRNLFHGNDLSNWTFNKPDQANSWSVSDGVLTNSNHGSDLVSVEKFRDFKLHVEFRCAAGCNSGVYLRGRYEIQIAASAAANVPPNRRAGAVYGFIAPSSDVTIRAGTWQSYDITLVGRTVSVLCDGHLVIDAKEIPGITGGALDSDEGAPGPIYLQGSERAGSTSFRNLVITPTQDKRERSSQLQKSGGPAL